MPPSQYLLHVNSRPTQVSDEVWRQWYKDEHLPDLQGAKVSDRCTFYEEIGNHFNPTPSHPRNFLALYQTSFEEALKSTAYQSLRRTSELFRKEGAGSDAIGENGDFDARYYSLLQEYDTKTIGETPPPQILTIYMNPENPEDYDRWYREEHLDLISKIPGWRRALRYKLNGVQTPLTKGSGPEEVQPYLVIHEVEDVAAFGSKEAEVATTTPWTKKNIEACHPVIARSWKLCSSEGY